MSSKKPSVPSYSQPQESKELENLLLQQATSLAKVPYEDWYSRFNVPEQPLATTAKTGLTSLMGEGYQPMGYEDYLKRVTPTETDLMKGVLGKYQGLLGETYGMEDYTKTEQDYLDTVLRKYGEARGEAYKPIQESLIAENLFGSGPGYGIMKEFGEETAQGVGDISKQWAYEGIQRKQQQEQYYDALKRGDYQTMYNLSLLEQQREIQPRLQATELANIEKQYYDALERGDIEQAFNMSQLLRANELYPIEQATNLQFGALEPASTLYGQLTQKELAQYQQMMQAYQARLGYGANIYNTQMGLLGKAIGAAGTAMAGAPA